MATMTKFAFDTRFDAQPAADEPAPQPEPEVPPLTEQDVADAREAGFAAGREAGLADATAAAQARLAEALAALAEQIGALGPGYRDTLAACRADAIGVGRTIAHKTTAAGGRDAALACVEETISTFLPRLLDEPRIVVRVDDSLLDALRERIEPLAQASGYTGGIVLLSEPGLALPDCRIEWADGGAQRDSAALWRQIDSAIESYLAAAGGDGPGAAGPIAPHPETDDGETTSEETADG